MVPEGLEAGEPRNTRNTRKLEWAWESEVLALSMKMGRQQHLRLSWDSVYSVYSVVGLEGQRNHGIHGTHGNLSGLGRSRTMWMGADGDEMTGTERSASSAGSRGTAWSAGYVVPPLGGLEGPLQSG